MSCNNYDSCSKTERNTLKYPTDTEALYANRVYDNQTANRRCYESNPSLQIIEGFGFSNDIIKNILKIVIVLLVLYVLYSIVRDMGKTEVKLSVPQVDTLNLSTLKF
jgi:hypothetical protein